MTIAQRLDTLFDAELQPDSSAPDDLNRALVEVAEEVQFDWPTVSIRGADRSRNSGKSHWDFSSSPGSSPSAA